MRNKLWKFVCSNLEEGSMLPWWALMLRAILYPLDFFYWKMSQSRGYQYYTDTWIIEGVIFSAMALRQLAEAQGEVYQVSRIGDVVILKELRNFPQ